MKKLITLLLMMSGAILHAQSLNGTQTFSGIRGGGKIYTIINWNANYKIYEKNGFFYISINNPSVSVANNSLYGSYSKSDLGVSTWPHSDPTPYNFTLNLTVDFPGGSISKSVGTGKYDEVMIGEPKNKYSKTYNLSINSFTVSSVQSMDYNAGGDAVLDRLIAVRNKKSSAKN